MPDLLSILPDIVGVIGTFMLILAFFLLQAEKIKSDSFAYLYLNAFAAVFILYSLCFSFNLASFIIEIFWIAISIYGLWKRYKKKRHLKSS